MSKLIFRSLAIVGFLLAMLAACLADPQPPAWQGVYEGTIGSAHVVAALAEDGARYFYAGKANDLGLIVSAQGTALSIEETLTPTIADDDLKDHPQLLSGLWKVNFADDAIKGTWTDAQEKHPLPISLRRVSTADQSLYGASTSLGNPGAYGGRWIKAAPALVAEAKEEIAGPLTFRLLRDPQFGGAVPRLLRAPPNVNIEAVNQSLDRLQIYLRLQDRDCFQGLRANRARTAEGKIGDIDKSGADETSPAVLTPGFATDHVLTLDESEMTYCGGAHPDQILETFTFDLSDGAQLTSLGFEDSNEDLGPKALGRVLDLESPAKRAKFTALWMGMMRAAIKADRKGAPPSDDDCGKIIEDAIADTSNPASIAVFPTSKGLAVRVVSLFSAAQACEDQDPYNPIIISYAALKPFLKPGQQLLP
jgi:hypothetical protein